MEVISDDKVMGVSKGRWLHAAGVGGPRPGGQEANARRTYSMAPSHQHTQKNGIIKVPPSVSPTDLLVSLYRDGRSCRVGLGWEG